MRRSIAMLLIACLGLLSTTSCGVLFPTSKVTYMGHSPADVLSAIRDGKVRSVQVNTPANVGAVIAKQRGG